MQFTEVIENNPRLTRFEVWYDFTEDKFYGLKVFNKENRLDVDWYYDDGDFYLVTDMLRTLISNVSNEIAA